MQIQKEAQSGKLPVKQLSSGDISVFCLQLSLNLKAGIPLYEGIAVLTNYANENEKQYNKTSYSSSFSTSAMEIKGALGKAAKKMADCLETGERLSSAMKKTGIFPGYVINMVDIGEETGNLDSVLESLGEYYEREQYMRAKIRNALLYPVILFIIMSAVIVLLVGRVFPIFKSMLESMGGSLSAGEEAAAAFAGSLAAGEYTMYIILSLAAASVIIGILSGTTTGRSVGRAFFAAFPLTKNITRKISASRFANAMAMTLSSGMDFNSAMRISVSLIDADALKSKFENCAEEIEAGESFSKAIAKTGIFSGMYIKFIEIGQKTGNVDSVMKKISDICENEADSSIINITSLIEPLLVGVLSVIIGVILVSVMIPLVQVMANIA